MENETLNDRIEYTCNLFMRIVIFALFGLIFSYALNIDPYKSYDIIIAAALFGATISVFDVLKRIFDNFK